VELSSILPNIILARCLLNTGEPLPCAVNSYLIRRRDSSHFSVKSNKVNVFVWDRGPTALHECWPRSSATVNVCNSDHSAVSPERWELVIKTEMNGLALRVAEDEGGTQTLGRQRHSMSEQACMAGGVRAPHSVQVRRAEIDSSRGGRNGEERRAARKGTGN
jgi:hypothetical protein